MCSSSSLCRRRRATSLTPAFLAMVKTWETLETGMGEPETFSGVAEESGRNQTLPCRRRTSSIGLDGFRLADCPGKVFFGGKFIENHQGITCV